MEGAASDLQLSNISALFTTEILHQCTQLAFKQKYNGSDVPEISGHSISFASSNGDGYLGTIYRITVQFVGNKSVNLIGKGLPANEARRKAFQCERFFTKEVFFYNKVVPEFRKLEQSEKFLAIPECFYAISDGKNDFLVLEDLTDDGFFMNERSASLSGEHIQSVTTTIAKFHAYSFALKHLYPGVFQEISRLDEPLFSLERAKWFEKYLLKLSGLFIESVEDELENIEYLHKFKAFVNPKTVYQTMMETVKLTNDVVINHGDLWITNFMFKGVNVKILDFQLVRCGSPILDLATAIFSCTDHAGREECGGLQGMLKTYHEELTRTVTSLGAPEPLTLQQLRDMWRAVGVHGLGCAVELALLALAEDVADLDQHHQKITLEDLVQFPAVTSEYGKRRLANLIKFAVEEGLI